MKKYASIIALCMVIVLCIPTIHAQASSNTEFIIRCRTTVPQESTGNGAVLYGSVFPDGQSSGDAMRQHIIEGLATFDFSQLQGYDYYFVGANRTSGTGDNPATGNIFVFWFNSSAVPLYTTGNSPSSTVSNSFYASIGSTFKVQSLYVTTSGYGSWSTVDTLTTQNNLNNSVYGACTNVQYVLDCNFAVNSWVEAIIKSGYTNGSNDLKQWYLNGGFSECTDLFDNTQGYNAQGQIVDGSGQGIVEVESNENHLYLKSCDVGFCKPYSVSDLSSAGGGYLYVKYTYDNWINSHSSDYWVNIRTVVNVDGTQYSGINTRALDLNGVNVLTFKESTTPNAWNDEGLLFVEFPNNVVSTYKNGYVYSIPYATFAGTESGGINNRSRFLGNGRNRLFLTPHGGRGVDITEYPLGQALEDLFQIISHNQFTITVTVWLQDTDNNRSGEFTKSFNLLTGVGTTMDTGITDNDNPFEPDPSLPDIPDGTSGDSNSVAPIVNNTVINMGGKFEGVFHDDSLDNLKETVDAYPQVPNQHFWDYFLVYKDNAFLDATSDFFGALPSELSSLLISSIGIIGVFAIYRFVRRR